MIEFIYYLIAVVMAVVVFMINYATNKKSDKAYSIVLRTVSIIFSLVFLCRYMLGEDAIRNMHALTGTPFDGALNVFALLLVWFTYAGNLLLCLFGFFKIKRLNNLVKCISLPMSILNLIFMQFAFTAIIGEGAINEFSVRALLFAIEIGIALGYSVSVLVNHTDWALLKERRERPKKEVREFKRITSDDELVIHSGKSRWIAFCKWMENAGIKVWNFFCKYWFDIFVVLVIFLSVMPAYTLEGLFGEVHQITKAKDLEFAHRLVLYIGIILPVILHFTLKNKDYAEKKFYLLYICLGTLLSFSLNHKFDSFLDPTRWPLHLCNTAMYIMPIVLIFNMKRFFYFTYFINVLGAFFAMIMPNYNPDNINLFDTSLLVFYINHYIAFFMPILFVSLKMFEKPRFKQFVYSMLGFLGYFVIVLVLNAMFSGMYAVGMVSQTTDFFFINSDFIADKLGVWAEQLRDYTATISVGGIDMVFYPVYQVLFFIVYVLLGLAVWFLYEQCYAIANSFEDIKQRKKALKLDKLALMSKLKGRSLQEPMEPENKNKLILRNFSKKYASSKVYAVKNANLEVNGGEIFGFLGPNGAGKSTIIKSIVGIQPITSGQIEVCGYDVDKQSVEAKRQIGFVPDHYALYEKLTGREYINYIADLYEVPIDIRKKRIDSFVKRFELENAFDNQMKTYSHGMKQKIAIMAALVHNPKIWILDEPLTGLDPNSIFQVKECMKEHARAGNIVFFSSHIIDVVERICDKIAIIKKGNILLTKSLAEIEASGDTLENFYMTTINGKDYAEHIGEDLAMLESNETVEKSKSEKPKKKWQLWHKNKGKEDAVTVKPVSKVIDVESDTVTLDDDIDIVEEENQNKDIDVENSIDTVQHADVPEETATSKTPKPIRRKSTTKAKTTTKKSSKSKTSTKKGLDTTLDPKVGEE